MNKFILYFLFLYSFTVIKAQLPTTNIITVDYVVDENKVEIDKPLFITGFNTSGYNNQPYFTGPDELLITSSFEAKGKTDIFLLNTKGRILKRVTATEQSEYSPNLNSDGTISVVREELGNHSPTLQFLWKYPADRSSFGLQGLSEYDNIGYYCWLPNQKVALFLVGERNKLVIVDMLSGEETFVSYNIGRCLRYDNNGGLLYVQKLGSAWTLRRQDLSEDISEYIGITPTNSEDFEILPNGSLISSEGTELQYFDMTKRNGWSKIIDLSSLGIKDISRIARSGKKLALVISN